MKVGYIKNKENFSLFPPQNPPNVTRLVDFFCLFHSPGGSHYLRPFPVGNGEVRASHSLWIPAFCLLYPCPIQARRGTESPFTYLNVRNLVLSIFFLHEELRSNLRPCEGLLVLPNTP